MNRPSGSPNPIDPIPRQISWDTFLFIIILASIYWTGEVGWVVPLRQDNNFVLITNLLRILIVDPVPAFMIIAIMAYVVGDLYPNSHSHLIKLALIIVCLFAFVVVPTLIAIQERRATGGVLYIHDGALQVEEAAKFLLAGKNPYVEDYTLTPLARWPYHENIAGINPALYHLVYFPFTFILSAPFYLVTDATLGWYDQRFLYLGMLFLTIPLILLTMRGRREQLVALMIITLNPLFIPFFIEGRNDIMIWFWSFAGILALQHRRVGWASLFVGLAAASKQTAWFLIPFFIIFAWKLSSGRKFLNRVWRLMPGAVAFATIVLPFALWNWQAFYEDVINYESGIGASTTLFPIKSLGLGSLVLGLGLINDTGAAFPFAWFQIVIGGIVLVALLWKQRKSNTLSQMLMSYAFLLLTVSFFSRTFNDNHLGFVLTWLMLPSLVREPNV